jgi:hypothetical protein
MAKDRASEDSESAPWSPAEGLVFERSHETTPSTGRDLQRLALRRLEDMQHDLLNSDFAQGPTVSALRGEMAVQNWVAERLRLKQGRSYAIEREPKVADEKEPDVRFRAMEMGASVAVEIKVAETWSLRELEAALTDQLCGRYLRSNDARHGILLLVHQKAKRWRGKRAGELLKFDQIVTHLKTLAELPNRSQVPRTIPLNLRFAFSMYQVARGASLQRLVIGERRNQKDKRR